MYFGLSSVKIQHSSDKGLTNKYLLPDWWLFHLSSIINPRRWKRVRLWWWRWWRCMTSGDWQVIIPIIPSPPGANCSTAARDMSLVAWPSSGLLETKAGEVFSGILSLRGMLVDQVKGGGRKAFKEVCMDETHHNSLNIAYFLCQWLNAFKRSEQTKFQSNFHSR